MIISYAFVAAIVAGVVIALIHAAISGQWALRSIVANATAFALLAFIALAGPIQLGPG